MNMLESRSVGRRQAAGLGREGRRHGGQQYCFYCTISYYSMLFYIIALSYCGILYYTTLCYIILCYIIIML